MARHPKRGDVFGSESMLFANSQAEFSEHVRSLGLASPIPVAIVKPEQLIFKGKLVDPEYVRRELSVDPTNEFAILVRAWPLTATRILDYFPWIDCSFELYDENYITDTIRKGRELWNTYEFPRIQRVLKNARFGLITSSEYFKLFQQSHIANVQAMLEMGISPSSGYETIDKVNPQHIQMHNITPGAVHAEWAPLTMINKLSDDRRKAHIHELLIKTHEALVSMGALCLTGNQLKELPDIMAYTDMISAYGQMKGIMQESVSSYDPDKHKHCRFISLSDVLRMHILEKI